MSPGWVNLRCHLCGRTVAIDIEQISTGINFPSWVIEADNTEWRRHFDDYQHQPVSYPPATTGA